MRVKMAFTVACVTVALAAVPAAAAEVEVGSSVASSLIGLGENDFNTFGIPSSGFGLISPSVYVAFFAGPHIAVEPQVGMIWASSSGDSSHLLHVAGQVDYFMRAKAQTSPYVFGFAGILDASGASTNPKTVGAGAGYRFPVGDRLAFRFDGRFTHYTEEGGHTLTFTLSIGGVVGGR